MNGFQRLNLIGVLLLFFCHCTFIDSINAATAPVTLFAPGLPAPEKNTKNKKNESSTRVEETDILIALVEPYEYTGREIDRPQLFGMYFQSPFQENQKTDLEWIDLLSDIEEIRYLNHKAWSANIDVAKPGLYKFVLETRPWWDERRGIFLQHQGKLLLPILGIDDGWNVPTGQSLEIVPLTNPFGLVAPAFFSGKFLVDGKPLPDMQIIMGKLNTTRAEAPTRWHEAMEARTDANGQFGFVLNKPGWWYCEARIPGNPLKGPDGEMRELLRSTLLWVHVGNANEKAVKKNQIK